MACVKLEILRQGPPQNQLLSPLTEYTALCADHPAAGVRVPFEHAQLTDSLRGLAYEGNDRDDGRTVRLHELGVRVGGILEQVPALVAELSQATGASDETLHLRLVLSANELALIPFELVVGPVGFPGAGQHLSLQTALPLCITREVRRAPGPLFDWPSRSKMLFAVGPGIESRWMQAHLLALVQAVQPWVRNLGSTPEAGDRALAEQLTFLPRASLRSITEACRTGEYTHVHILAHGHPYTQRDDRRFGVGLFHERAEVSTVDVVDGERLVAALRAHQVDGSRALARPAVVTLCSCQTANVGTVVGAGASVAHELHGEGIPLVIASQFPLSVDGSVHLTRLLYGPLLRGQDPRLVLDDVRRQLRALVPDAHDWASLVVYACLPSDIDRQLRDVMREQAAKALEAALTHLDASAPALSRTKSEPEYMRRLDAAITDAEARVKEPLATLQYLLKHGYGQSAELHGLLASAKKRLADIYFRAAKLAPADVSPPEGSRSWRESAEKKFREAQREYAKVFEEDRTQSWALVQSLVLKRVIGVAPNDLEPSSELADLLSKADSHHPMSSRAVCARRNVIELNLLALMEDPSDPKEIAETCRHELSELLNRVDPEDSELGSLRAQLRRYQDVFMPKVLEVAKLNRDRAEAVAEGVERATVGKAGIEQAAKDREHMKRAAEDLEHMERAAEDLEKTVRELTTMIKDHEGREPPNDPPSGARRTPSGGGTPSP